jgi:hypothetical protein
MWLLAHTLVLCPPARSLPRCGTLHGTRNGHAVARTCQVMDLSRQPELAAGQREACERLLAIEEIGYQFVEFVGLLPLRPVAAFGEYVQLRIGHRLEKKEA